MADFCKQCSIEQFGEDFGDLAGLADLDNEVLAICEGCGFIEVDCEGNCIAPCCDLHNNLPSLAWLTYCV